MFGGKLFPGISPVPSSSLSCNEYGYTDESECTSSVFNCHYSQRNNENCHKIFHFNVSIIQLYAVHTNSLHSKQKTNHSRQCAAC